MLPQHQDNDAEGGHMDRETTEEVAKAVEESAKMAGKALEIVHDTGGYLSRVFGNVPEDIVGVCGGAWLHERHLRIRDWHRRRTQQILQERDVREVVELSPNLAAALIAGAQEEGHEELMELWARLLANAMDPKLNTLRQSFIEVVKRMDPLDAVVLRYIYQAKITEVRVGLTDTGSGTVGVANIATTIDRQEDEVEVSLRHLKELLLFDQSPSTAQNHRWTVNATNRVFLRACYAEVKFD